MFLEKVTGVKAPNVSAWRRQTFGDFTSAFRFHDKPSGPPIIPDTAADFARAKYEVATLPKPAAPTGQQAPPVQAQGKRPTVPVRGDRKK
jgi:phospholipase C